MDLPDISCVAQHLTSLKEAPVEACMVVERDRAGYVFHCRLDLSALPGPDRQIVALFISKGRGAPQLAPPGSK